MLQVYSYSYSYTAIQQYSYNYKPPGVVPSPTLTPTSRTSAAYFCEGAAY